MATTHAASPDYRDWNIDHVSASGLLARSIPIQARPQFYTITATFGGYAPN
jgi:hypothetical protein